jgi:hypothetical protein
MKRSTLSMPIAWYEDCLKNARQSSKNSIANAKRELSLAEQNLTRCSKQEELLKRAKEAGKTELSFREMEW